MCNNCNSGACILSKVGKLLLIVGGLNWGILGVGMLMGKMAEWNVVEMLLGKMPTLLAVVYVLVGLSAILGIFGCPCKQCKGACTCDTGSTK
ncbi:MAG: DUF378 domain-containing protein [Candidatus Pacebacteria bacterium]|nr:DUF378 domain-containing protein [Candidatus Paceibacterota bacterium]